jgi:CysZ protein
LTSDIGLRNKQKNENPVNTNRLLKEIVIAIQSYFRAHQFISKHRLWKWIILPGLLYSILFIVGMYFFWKSSNVVVAYISDATGLGPWLERQESSVLKFLFILGSMIVKLVLMFFYFSLFKHIFLIVGSPLFAYLSEKTESIIEGKDFPFSFAQLLKDSIRGIKLAVRNMLWQTVYTVSILLLSLFPFIGLITPMISLFLECYYYGFSMLDYSCERHKMSPAESIDFIARHKGLAIGNGLVFYLMHLLPVVGWVLAPAYAVVAATISLYHSPEAGIIIPKQAET